MLTSKEFANKLRDFKGKTEQTNDFEEERDKAGIRKYAQKNKRWWDESTGIQKEHIVCWFARKYYFEGSTKECIKDNLIKEKHCKECFFEKNEIKENCGQTIGAKEVFTHMQRPEMYLYIAESLGAIDKIELEECITKLKERMNEKPRKWKEIIKNYITWEMIESIIVQK